MVTLLEELQLLHLKDAENELSYWLSMKGNSIHKEISILMLLDLKLLINEAYY